MDLLFLSRAILPMIIKHQLLFDRLNDLPYKNSHFVSSHLENVKGILFVSVEQIGEKKNKYEVIEIIKKLCCKTLLMEFFESPSCLIS